MLPRISQILIFQTTGHPFKRNKTLKCQKIPEETWPSMGCLLSSTSRTRWGAAGWFWPCSVWSPQASCPRCHASQPHATPGQSETPHAVWSQSLQHPSSDVLQRKSKQNRRCCWNCYSFPQRITLIVSENHTSKICMFRPSNCLASRFPSHRSNRGVMPLMKNSHTLQPGAQKPQPGPLPTGPWKHRQD